MDTRKMAYKSLIKSQCRTLPTDIITVATYVHDAIVVTYKDGADIIAEAKCVNYTLNHDAFILCPEGGGTYILYDSDLPAPEQHCAIAHEIGHLAEGHKPDDNGNYNPSDEQAADNYAVELLAPSIVLHALNMTDPHEIMSAANVTKDYAHLAIAHLLRRNVRDNEDEQLIIQMMRYITEHKKPDEQQPVPPAPPVKPRTTRLINRAFALIVIVALSTIIGAQWWHSHATTTPPPAPTDAATATPWADDTPEPTNAPTGTPEPTATAMAVPTATPAADAVHLTKTGKKYHRADCYTIKGKDNIREVTLATAIDVGYEPCSICKP